MESSARTEKMELLRWWWWWWWWWWLRSTRKGFEEEECHCCCLEFVEFTIKDGTSPLDWSSTSFNTPLNLPFTSIKALIATSVILFLSYHTYTHVHTYTSIYLVKLKLHLFSKSSWSWEQQKQQPKQWHNKNILQTERDPELQIRFASFPKIVNPSFDRFRY